MSYKDSVYNRLRLFHGRIMYYIRYKLLINIRDINLHKLYRYIVLLVIAPLLIHYIYAFQSTTSTDPIPYYASNDFAKQQYRYVNKSSRKVTLADIDAYNDKYIYVPFNQQRRNICIISWDIAGPNLNGGIGTATTNLALLLGQYNDIFNVSIISTNGNFVHPQSKYDWVGWMNYFNHRNVTLTHVNVENTHTSVIVEQQRSYIVYKWLLAEGSYCDIVHFHEYVIFTTVVYLKCMLR